jgi:hypothetical protein
MSALGDWNAETGCDPKLFKRMEGKDPISDDPHSLLRFAMGHRKCYLPLESNPEVFTHLLRNIGVSSLRFYDVLSIDSPDLLEFIPRPALALVLVFPTSLTYNEYTKKEESERATYSGCGEHEDVVWFKQTIHNACGLYAILHAVCNGEARQHIREWVHVFSPHVSGPSGLRRRRARFRSV